MQKYNNRKVTIDGHTFASTLEANRYCQLKLLQRAGEISDLQLQVPFTLQESFKKNGKTYKAIKYVADFVYTEKGKTIVEDTKSVATETQVFKIKQKLFEKRYADLELKIITREDM